jgi:hypothetical protein
LLSLGEVEAIGRIFQEGFDRFFENYFANFHLLTWANFPCTTSCGEA